MHVCECTRPRVRVTTCTHARTRKHAHTDQYVILIAFPLQQWFRERASVLRYTYIACLVLVFLLPISNRHAFKLTLHFREADKFCWRENRAVECLRNHWWFVFRVEVQEGGRRVRRTSSWWRNQPCYLYSYGSYFASFLADVVNQLGFWFAVRSNDI
jgi:hypothetical protein